MTLPATPMLRARTYCLLAHDLNPQASEKDRNLLSLYLRGVVRSAVEYQKGRLNFDYYAEERACGTIGCLAGWYYMEMGASKNDLDRMIIQHQPPGPQLNEDCGIHCSCCGESLFGVASDFMSTLDDLRYRAHRIHREIVRRGLRLPEGAHELVESVLQP